MTENVPHNPTLSYREVCEKILAITGETRQTLDNLLGMEVAEITSTKAEPQGAMDHALQLLEDIEHSCQNIKIRVAQLSGLV